jgi:hypothetical protein
MPEYTGVCLGIIQNERFLCTQQVIAGVNDRLVLLNYNDFVNAARTYDAYGRLTNLVLTTGTVAYVFEGKNNSVSPKQSLVRQTYSEGYDQKIDFLVFNTGQFTKNNLENMARTKMVGIVQNANDSFEVYGSKQGMILMTNDRDLQNADTGAAFQLALATPEKTKEPKLPIDLLATDFATTLALVNVLVGFPTISNVNPTAVSISGGTSVVITGTNLAGALAVTFGNYPAASFVINSSTQITAISPVLVAGGYKVSVDGAAGKVTGTQTVVAS